MDYHGYSITKDNVLSDGKTIRWRVEPHGESAIAAKDGKAYYVWRDTEVLYPDAGRLSAIFPDKAMLSKVLAAKAAPFKERLEARGEVKDRLMDLDLEKDHVCKIVDVFQDDESHLAVVSEAIERGEYIESVTLSDADYLALCLEMAKLVQKIHDRKVVHGQIRLESFVLARSGKPYLVDFTVALPEERKLGGCHYENQKPFMAPEIRNRDKVNAEAPLSKAVDIYALGVVFFYLRAQAHYKPGVMFSKEFDLEVKGGSLSSLLARMLDENAENRPSIAEVVEALCR